jgi:hypothetical protein
MTGPNEASYQGPIRPPDRRPSAWRIGIVAAAIGVLAVSAAITLAADPSASPVPGGGSQGQGGQVAPGKGPWGMFGGRGFGGPGMKGGWDGPAGRGFRDFAFGDITVTSVNGSSISLKTADGWTRTITVTSSTQITKGGQTIGVGDIKAGDHVVFRETRNGDGTFTIDAVAVVVPHVAGTVSAVSGSGFTMTARDGATWTITVNGSTKYTLGRTGATGSKADVKAGSNVLVEGTQGSGNTLTALSVHIGLPMAEGVVTAKSGDTLTVQRRDGVTTTIHVSSSTMIRVPGVASPSLNDITVGMRIAAEGTQRSDGSLDATALFAGRSGHGFDGGPKGQNGQAPSGSSGATPGSTQQG